MIDCDFVSNIVQIQTKHCGLSSIYSKLNERDAIKNFSRPSCESIVFLLTVLLLVNRAPLEKSEINDPISL